MESTKWQYMRDEASGLDELDEKLKHWGNLGWELASIIQTTESGKPEDENILTPERWLLVLKQPSTL